MKKSILDYKGKKITVDVPEHIEIISRLSDYIAEHIPLNEQFNHQDKLEQDNEEFIVFAAYSYISEYYDKIGKKHFGDNVEFTVFLNKENDNKEIVDYCEFEDYVPLFL